ncbi:peptidase M13, partial [Salmonella enterica subsp. enterica serovar Heidelberg]
SGTPQLRERWKRGVGLVEGVLGEEAGKLYVERHFPPEAKGRMQELVGNLVEAFRRSFRESTWMSPETQVKALEKLDAFTPKIGYPDEWRDYSDLQIVADDLVGNIKRSASFETDYQLAKIGQPIDRNEWLM